MGSSNLRTDSSKKYLAVFGIFALVIVTTAASYAFFTYSRVGENTTTITSGDIEFSYIEGTSANLANAFPVADSIGAADTTGEYIFDVRMSSSSQNYKMNYNVMLVDNNNDESVNYFTNEQIKFSLIKDNVYVANTSETVGVKLSTIPGFSEGSSNGYGYVLQDQEITSGKTDNYKLRIWISDDVTYSDEIDENGTMTGKYNSYKYSLKVKVTSGLGNTTLVDNLETAGPAIIAELSDPNGLDSYAVTQSSTAPENESTDWIDIIDTTSKSKTMRLASNLITRKTIRHEVTESGTYYLHVRNKKDEISTKEVIVSIDKYIITFDGNGGTSSINSKEVINKTTYGELPTATRTGYIFDGWYTSNTDGEKITDTSGVDINENQTLYARWISKTFADKAAVLTEFTGTTAETIMCEASDDENYYNCDEMTLAKTGTEERDGTIFLLKDVSYDVVRYNTSNIKTLDMNGYDIGVSSGLRIEKILLNIVDDTQTSSISTTNSYHSIQVANNSDLNIRNININQKLSDSSSAILVTSGCSKCNINMENVVIDSQGTAVGFNANSSGTTVDINNCTFNTRGTTIVNSGTNNIININGGKYISKEEYVIHNSSAVSNISNAYIEASRGAYNHSAILVDSGNVTINGNYPTFDSEGNYLSGTYIYSNAVDKATIHIDNGTLKVNGGYIYHDSAENGTWRQHALRMLGGTVYLNGGTFESLGVENLSGSYNRVVYLNSGNSVLYVNGAIIKGGLRLNYNPEESEPDTTAYICSGSIEKIDAGDGTTDGNLYFKSSGINWGKVPTLNSKTFIDDTITCE